MQKYGGPGEAMNFDIASPCCNLFYNSFIKFIQKQYKTNKMFLRICLGVILF